MSHRERTSHQRLLLCEYSWGKSWVAIVRKMWAKKMLEFRDPYSIREGRGRRGRGVPKSSRREMLLGHLPWQKAHILCCKSTSPLQTCPFPLIPPAFPHPRKPWAMWWEKGVRPPCLPRIILQNSWAGSELGQDEALRDWIYDIRLEQCYNN